MTASAKLRAAPELLADTFSKPIVSALQKTVCDPQPLPPPPPTSARRYPDPQSFSPSCIKPVNPEQICLPLSVFGEEVPGWQLSVCTVCTLSLSGCRQNWPQFDSLFNQPWSNRLRNTQGSFKNFWDILKTFLTYWSLRLWCGMLAVKDCLWVSAGFENHTNNTRIDL